jgi:MFS family permease
LAGWLSDEPGRRKLFVYLASILMIVGLLMTLVMPSVTGTLAMSAINGFTCFGGYLALFGFAMLGVTAAALVVIPIKSVRWCARPSAAPRRTRSPDPPDRLRMS